MRGMHKKHTRSFIERTRVFKMLFVGRCAKTNSVIFNGFAPHQ